MEPSNLLIVAITLLSSAFFSGVEIAFLTSNKLKLETDKQKGVFSAKLIARMSEKPSRFIGTLLLGNNVALVIYGIFMAKILGDILSNQWGIESEGVILLIQTILSTILVLVTAEFIPKSIFRINPNLILGYFAVPIALAYYSLYVFTIITIGLSEFVLKYVLKADMEEEQVAFGMVDLDEYVKEVTDNVNEDEVEHEVIIYQNAREFVNRKIRECMVPRTDIVAIDIETSIPDLLKLFIDTGMSKILIYKESIDNIIGYTHAHEVFKRPEHLKQIIIPIGVVPESMGAQEVLKSFTKEKRSVAVVVDEFGGTSGMVTIEDIVEEIFGEIVDEHDKEELVDVQLDDDTFHFNAKLEVDAVNAKYDLTLTESENYETIAGLVLDVSADIPEEGEMVDLGDYTAEIMRVADNRIEEVRITRKDSAE